jgi:DNA polymerase-3 subunit alpha
MPAVAITDHGNLCGAIEFYMGANKAGLKPILGCEVHVKLPDPPMESRSAEDKLKSSRLVLLARDLEGYKNLSRLLSRGYLEGRSGDRPLLTREWLKDYKEGLIAIPAGLKSEIAWNLLRGREANAALAFDFLLDLYGPNFYAGLDAGRLKETQIVNEWMLARAREKGVKPVAMGNVHYLDREDADSHEVLSCIKLGRTIQDSARRASSDDYWLKDAATMTEIFSETPEALDHTLEVAAACNVEFKFTNDKGHQIYHLPTFKIPEGESTENLDEFLRIEGERGLDWRFAQDAFKALQAEPTWPETELAYRTRLAEETAMIQKTGFAGYFLIVSDFIRWAKEKGVPVGPGRGSGAGSLVAWALRITDIDPIPYNLLFERFINPERISMPDFDVDFCQDRREEVIDYVKAKYGKEKVTQIITFGKLQTKNCIRDIGRVLGMPYGEVDTIAKLVPEK